MLRKLLAAIGGFWLLAMQQPNPSHQELLNQADAYYAEKSFAKAHQIYLKVPLGSLETELAKWVDFRRADTLWRSGSGQGADDSSQLQQARRKLEELVEREGRKTGRPGQVWAEAHLSLADMPRPRNRYSSDGSQPWLHYQKALDWWAGSQDVEAARRHYLDIALKAFSVQGTPPSRFYLNHYFQNLPNAITMLEKAHSIAVEPEDRAATSFLLASYLIRSDNVYDSKRAAHYFEQLIGLAGQLAWGERALFEYAQWLENNGPLEYDEEGNPVRRPDPAQALQLYRRLLEGSSAGESAFHKQSQRRIEQITASRLEVRLSNAFLPGSEVQFQLSWRNLSSLNLDLFAIDLTRGISPTGNMGRHREWNKWPDLEGRRPLHSWKHQLPEVPRYQLGQQAVTLPHRLDPGAYVLRGRSGDTQGQAILLVSRASLVLLSSRGQVTVYFCDAWDGSPLADARLSLWERTQVNNSPKWVQREAATDSKGMARFETLGRNHRSIHAFARKGGQQAYARSYARGRQDGAQWTFHTITDRPAYRPGETAQWKAVARLNEPDGYSTPSGRNLVMVIQDPQSREVLRQTVTLNEFGSAWGSLELTSQMPLGMYSALFFEPNGDRTLHRSQLFRLEEYKLPEFRVDVEIPQQDGQPKIFRPGERIEALVKTEYYFGGPVAGARVEVVVRQKPFRPFWRPPRRYPWLYRNSAIGVRPYNPPGTEVHRQSLTADASGQVRFSYQPVGAAEDREYGLEARVRDSSRREVVGRASIKATRQRVFLFPKPRKAVYRPGDLAQVELWVRDANQQPVQTDGTLTVSREHMIEVWYDPQGRFFEGDNLERIRKRLPRGPDLKGWTRQWRVEREEVMSKVFRSGKEGKAEFSFRPEKPGRYQISWFSPDPGAKPAKAEAPIWVASNSTTELGIRSGGVQIVLESEAVHPGGKVLVLLSLAEPDGYVLLSRQSGHSGGDLQLIRVEGTAKLVELDVTETDLPNLHLSAALVSRGNLHQDNKEIVVHPEERFLRLEVAPDRDDYQPREKGKIDLRVLDHEGNPVRAELALSVADESVFAIQQSLNSDPRRIYYGRRDASVQFTSSFQIQSYRRLVKDESNQLAIQYYDLPINGRVGGVIGGIPGGIPFNAMVRASASGSGEVRLARLSSSGTQNLFLLDASRAVSPTILRSDFRSTLLWQPGLVSDDQGRVSVPVEFADKLTSWRATVQALTSDSRFGSAEATMRTSQPLIVRLQAPRFFVQGDEVTVSAVIHNYSERPETVQPQLHWTGVRFEELSAPSEAVQIPAGGEQRADWRLKVLQAGQARFRAEARGSRLADAVEQTYPVYEHGLERFIARSGKVGADESLIELELPRERRPQSTRLQITLTPSLAAAMLDALPYLIEYPYGCTEQTMSRFLPAVVVAKTLRDQGVASEILESRLFGGLSARTTKKEGSGMARLDDVIEQGLQRLYSFQHGDGGWGWWKEGQTDLYMTSYVLWGFGLAALAGVEVDPDAMGRAFRFLDTSLVEASQDPDLQAWILQALTSAGKANRSFAASAFQRTALDNLWHRRQDLSAAGRALLALSAHRLGQAGRVGVLLRNLENGVRRDNSSASSLSPQSESSRGAQSTQTAHWGSTQSYRRWWEGAVESTALHLQALIEIEPSHPLVEPAIQWLVQNRRGNQWSNTRDTALSVLALDEYLKATGELESGAGFEVLVNGQRVASGSLRSLEEALARPVRIEVEPRLLRDGLNRIQIRRTSAQGSLYFAAEARFFSLEEPIPSGGNQVLVQRDYYRLVPVQTLLKGTAFERHRLQPGEALQSGERVEVILTLEAKNDLTYLILEDLKPAGLESVEVQSGSGPPACRLSREAVQERQASGKVKPPCEGFGIRRHVYRELRDRKVALFIDRLDQGWWEIRYQMRAEVPGRFHALPVVAQAMYSPDIRANSREQSLEVFDR